MRERVPALAMVAVLLASLGGCVPSLPQGEAREANDEVPDGFGATAGGESPGGESAANMDWRDLFDDPQLVALIDEALEHNQELNIAVQENFIASYETMARRGEIFPTLGVGAEAGVDRVAQRTSQGQSDEMAELGQTLGDYSIGLVASWEVDVWGRLRNLADAAAQRYLASVSGRHFMVTLLVAEIAGLYYELMALDRQLDVVTTSVQLQEDALRVVRLQWQAGQTTSLAVRRFEAELNEFQSRQYGIRQRLVETENRINFLVGRFPQHVERRSDGFMDLEPRQLATGLPSELLTNRPDVRAAELQMAAAQLDVDAARARYFPRLSFDAAIGFSSFDIVSLFETPASLFANLFGNLTAPLFNRTGITADYFSSDARRRQAIIQYERSILNAYIEVVNRLNRVENLSASYEVREQRVARLQESIDISTQLFASARADYLEVLTARRDSLDAQIELIENKQRQLSAVVGLYQALGGGWHRPDEDEDAAEETSEDEEEQ